jgi:RNA polymerase sigma-70 factor (ECF subfamily)
LEPQRTVPESAALTAPDDLALIDGMRRGDERAAAELYDRHGSTVFALTFRITRDHADAEGLLLETFTQAWRDASRFSSSRGSVLSWLLTIARSRALDLVRARTRREKRVPLSVDDAPALALAADDPPSNPAHAVEQREQREALAAALRALPEPQRVAIALAFYDGLTHAEIADHLDEPLGTVKTRIRAGMLKMREALRPHRAEAAR